MKDIIKYMLIVCIFATAPSCKMELSTYNQERNSLNFLYPTDTTGGLRDYITIRQTLVYLPIDVEFDTIWVPVRTLGFITDRDRKVSLRQANSDEPMAVAGKHYVPFNDAELTSKYYWIRAGMNSAKIPVVIKRHPDLKDQEYSLMLEIDPNEDFDQGYLSRSTRLAYIADILMQPTNWDAAVTYYFLGSYGKVKHQFMIDCVRDRGMIIDYDWIKHIMPQNPPDMAYTEYWCGFFTGKLIELNKQRVAQGADVLREAPTSSQTEGAIVRFNLNGTPQPYI